MPCADPIPSARMTRVAARAGPATRSRVETRPIRIIAASSNGFADTGGAAAPAAWRLRSGAIFHDEPRRDAGSLEDHRQSAARMGAATDEVHIASEAVVRPEIEHLREIVRQVESGSVIDG